MLRLVESAVHFVSESPPRNNFRLGFAATPYAVIDPGLRALGLVCRELGIGSR